MKRILGAVTVICVAALWAGSALADGDDAWVTEVTTDDLNLGSGTQTNANDWHDMFDVNVDGNQLTGGGINSNGGDRNSDDVVILSGAMPEVANYALDASVSEFWRGGELLPYPTRFRSPVLKLLQTARSPSLPARPSTQRLKGRSTSP